MTVVKAWAALGAKQALVPFEYEIDAPSEEEVEVEVLSCGVCRTDLVFIDNDWGNTLFPLVPGHEIVGRITKLGKVAASKGLSVGQHVGVGWNKESCLHCAQCFKGDSHLCDSIQGTMLGHHGGYASHIKAHWHWVIPLPGRISAVDAGPMLCAGITAFAPLLEYNLRPTDRIGVLGIGGLGHLALQFVHAWGAETVAFSSSASKRAEIGTLGASAVVSSLNNTEWDAWQGSFDLLLVTSSHSLNWERAIAMLAPNGRLHAVGLIGEPAVLCIPSLIAKQKQLAASPGGSRSAMSKMLSFAARHGIKPITEHFPMSRVNDALARLRAGNAHYRIVLDADFSG